jgi:hypothetical protein
MENNNKLSLTNQEVVFRNGEIVNIEIGDILVSSSEVKEITSITKENDYVRFTTKGGRFQDDSVGEGDVRSYYTVLKGHKLEKLQWVAISAILIRNTSIWMMRILQTISNISLLLPYIKSSSLKFNFV